MKRFTKKSDPDVFLHAAIDLGLEYEILSERNGTIRIYNNFDELIFKNTNASFNSHAAHSIARDKFLTSKILRKNGVPVPECDLFALFETEEIAKYIQDNAPSVIKPNIGHGGDDVFVNISKKDEVYEILDIIQKRSSKKEILVEKYHKGIDYRVVVFRGEVIDVITRVPAFIIGDGINSIDNLIKIKNQVRKEVLGGFIIRKDYELKNKLKEQKLDLKSSPEKGRRVQLKDKCNYSAGGETQKINLSTIHKDNIELFKNIPKYIKLDLCGVDFISNDLSKSYKEGEGVVNEINSSIGIDIHYFADMKRDLHTPKRILSKYFGLNYGAK